MPKIQATFIYSGMVDYWGGDGDRWDDNKGCLFSHYDGRTPLRDIIDGAVDDFCSGGDCDTLHADITEDHIRAALLEMLSDAGRADYESDAVAECAQEFADANGYSECRECGNSIGDEHDEDCNLFDVPPEDGGIDEDDTLVTEDHCTDPDGSDDDADFPMCVFLIETEICSECGAWAEHYTDDVCKACAEKDDQAWFVNYYKCGCGQEWEYASDCACDDRCPDCDTSISPYKSEDVSRDTNPIDPEVRKKVIEAGGRILGMKIDPGACDFCEDGSVWYGLIQILPTGTIVTSRNLSDSV